MPGPPPMARWTVYTSIVTRRPELPKWVVYIVECTTGELYTGSTTDLERRVQEHNSGRGAKFTRARIPVELVYREEVNDRSEALRRELQIKSMKRTEKLELIHSSLKRRERRRSRPGSPAEKDHVR